MFKCEFCDKEFSNKYQYDRHIDICKFNPCSDRYAFNTYICEKCGKAYFLIDGVSKRFCSRSCCNSRSTRSDETRDKISRGVLESIKNRKQSGVFFEQLESYRKRLRLKRGLVVRYCEVCGKQLSKYKSKSNLCIDCYLHSDIRKTPIKDFIKRSNEIHGDKYDYSEIKYVDWNTKVSIICPIHGRFDQTPNSHLSGHGCPKCNSSKGERAISSWLIRYGIDFENEKSFDDLLSLRKLRYDFYVSKYNLLIEFNGRQHYEYSRRFHKNMEGFENLKKRDELKKNYAESHNIRILIIPYWDRKNIASILEDAMFVDYT